MINQIITNMNNQLQAKDNDVEAFIKESIGTSLKALLNLKMKKISEIAITILNVYSNPDNIEKSSQQICRIISNKINNRYTKNTIERQLIPDFKKLISILYPDINTDGRRFREILNDLQRNIKQPSKKEIIYYIACSSNGDDRRFLANLERNIQNYNIKTVVSTESNPINKVKENIRNSDVFSVIVSENLLNDAQERKRIGKELDLAIESHQNNITSKPKIIFVGNNINDLSDINFFIPNVDKKSKDKAIAVGDWESVNISSQLQENEIYKLMKRILPPIDFIEDLDEQSSLFRSSELAYELFFPIRCERLPFEEIERRIAKYNMENSKEWYEVYAIWHINDEISIHVIGMSYSCLHLSTGWIFGNYLAIDGIFRSPNRLSFLYANIKEKIESKIELNKLKGIVFEIEPIDFDFLVTVAELKTDITGSEKEDKFITEFRRFRRLNLFTSRKNVYLILDDKRKPFPYVQPGMDEPVKENDTQLILMVELLNVDNVDLKNESNKQLVGEILNFLYENLFLSGSVNRAEGYKENVEQVKISVGDKLQKLERCIFGKIEDITLDNSKYTCEELFQELISKARNEKMREKVKLF